MNKIQLYNVPAMPFRRLIVYRFLLFLYGIAMLVDSLVIVLTLGMFYSTFATQVLFLNSKYLWSQQS